MPWSSLSLDSFSVCHGLHWLRLQLQYSIPPPPPIKRTNTQPIDTFSNNRASTKFLHHHPYLHSSVHYLADSKETSAHFYTPLSTIMHYTYSSDHTGHHQGICYSIPSQHHHHQFLPSNHNTEKPLSCLSCLRSHKIMSANSQK